MEVFLQLVVLVRGLKHPCVTSLDREKISRPIIMSGLIIITSKIY